MIWYCIIFQLNNFLWEWRLYFDNSASAIWQCPSEPRSCAWESGACPTVSGRVIQPRMGILMASSVNFGCFCWFHGSTSARDVPTQDPRTREARFARGKRGKVGNCRPFSNLATPHPVGHWGSLNWRRGVARDSEVLPKGLDFCRFLALNQHFCDADHEGPNTPVLNGVAVQDQSEALLSNGLNSPKKQDEPIA